MKKIYLVMAVAAVAGMVFCTGTLDVSSEPAGAQVWLNDSNTGKVTNAMLEKLPPGEHNLKLAMEGYMGWDTMVTLSGGKTVAVSAMLEKATGSLQVNTTPKGAKVLINGEKTGKVTNVLIGDLPAGMHKLTLVMANGRKWDTTFTISADQVTTVTYAGTRRTITTAAVRPPTVK